MAMIDDGPPIDIFEYSFSFMFGLITFWILIEERHRAAESFRHYKTQVKFKAFWKKISFIVRHKSVGILFVNNDQLL